MHDARHFRYDSGQKATSVSDSLVIVRISAENVIIASDQGVRFLGCPMSDDQNSVWRFVRPGWWFGLIVGILLIIYGLLILSLRPTTVLSLAILVGVAFILGGITMFGIAGRVIEWRWLFYLAGVLAIIAAVVAFFWPGVTLLVIAGFLAWYLVIGGGVTVIGALAGPRHDWWWVSIILGALQFVLGVWAIASPGREVLLLVNLVGIYLVFTGFTEILLSMTLRKWARQLDEVASGE